MAGNSAITVMKDGTMISSERGEVFDFLQSKELDVHVQVKVAANSGQTLQLQHSAVNEEEMFENLGTTFDIATVGNEFKNYGAFLRYVRLLASNSITTQPTLSIAIIARKG